MVTAVIGASIIYYLNLEWWWWLIFAIAVIVDISEIGANTTNSANAVNNLSSIDDSLNRIEDRLETIEDSLDKE